MWLARDKDNNLYLYIYSKPFKGINSGIFYPNINIKKAKQLKNLADQSMNECNCVIRIFETDDTYKNITWENSPVELTYKL